MLKDKNLKFTLNLPSKLIQLPNQLILLLGPSVLEHTLHLNVTVTKKTINRNPFNRLK